VVRPGPTHQHEKRTDLHDTAVKAIEEAYSMLIADGVPAEDARGLIPLNVLMQGHYKTNLRNLATEIGKRTCTQAQWEWRMILLSMRQSIRQLPWLQNSLQRARSKVPPGSSSTSPTITALATGLLQYRTVHVQGEG
jgi:thymidylate synthase ThyX